MTNFFRITPTNTFLALICATIGTSAFAAESGKKDPLHWVPPTHIQMIPMMIPAGHTTIPITFFLEATTRERTDNICRSMPRIRDALLITLSREPIPVKRRRLVLDGVDDRILTPLNDAVGKPYVKKIYITPGAVKMGSGKIKRRPLAEIDSCENILRSELERKQAAKAAAEK